MRIESTIDFSSLAREYGTLIPAKVLNEVGIAYRLFREKTLLEKKQLHDLSAMPPLKPKTIARKMGLVKKGTISRPGRFLVESQKVKFGMKRKIIGHQFHAVYGRGMGAIRRGGVRVSALYPDVPLVYSGNLLRNVTIDANPGRLILDVGPTRKEIAEYHQAGSQHTGIQKALIGRGFGKQIGGGRLPKRIHMAWNPGFITNEAIPLILAHYRMAIRRAKNA